MQPLTSNPVPKAQAAPAARRPRLWLMLVLLLVGSLIMGYTIGLQNAPLGAPLPPKPVPLIKLVNDSKEISILKRQVGERVLQYLAPQPDGSPPLDLRQGSSRAGYSMKFPPGTQAATMPPEIYDDSGLDLQAQFKFDQAIFLLDCYLLPRKPGESFTAAVKQLAQQRQKAATSGGGVEPYPAISGTQFVRFEYYAPSPENEPEYRQIFATPYGVYIVVLDFMAKAQDASIAKLQAAKIMATFESTWPLEQRNLPQDAPQ